MMWRRAPSQPVASVSDAGVGGWWWFFSPSTGGGEPVATVCPVSSVGNAMGSTFSFASPGGGETSPGSGELVTTVCFVFLVEVALETMLSPPFGGGVSASTVCLVGGMSS